MNMNFCKKIPLIENFNIRYVKKKDCSILFKWANDPLVRSNAFSQKNFTFKHHKKWLYNRIKDKKNCLFFIAETKEGLPFGQVRLDKKNNQWHINFSLAAFAREKKLAAPLIKKVINTLDYTGPTELIAIVKKGNIRSFKTFKRNQFKVKKNFQDKILFSYKLKKSFLVIGGGFGQVPAIKEAKLKNFNVIVVDRNPKAIGMKLADIAINKDVIDVNSIIDIARKYSVAGVLTMQSDIGIPAVGAVVEDLKLNGPNKRVASLCSNKILMRKAFRRHGVQQPAFQVVRNLKEASNTVKKFGYPCVLKAIDSSASRGVIRIDSQDSVVDSFKKARFYSSSKELLVEEFIEGIEFGAQTFSVEGKCKLILIHNDEMSPYPYMIPTGHSFPSTLNKTTVNKAKKIIKNALKALGIKNGPANIDLILDGNNNIKIIEIGSRIGATCLPELVQYHTGINITNAAIMNACGKKPNLKIKKLKPCSAQILEAYKKGIFKSYKFPNKLKRNPNVLEFEVTVKPGDKIQPLTKGTDRIGKIISTGKSIKAAEKLSKDCKLAFKTLLKR